MKTSARRFLSCPFFIATFLLVFATILLVACSKNSTGGNPPPPPDCSGPLKTFVTDVNPIIQSFCNNPGCHTSGSTNGPGPLTNYSQVFNARNSIRAAVASGEMPLNAALSTSQRNAIICWIDNGAQDN